MERAARDARDDLQIFLRPVVELIRLRAHQVDEIDHQARMRLVVVLRRPLGEEDRFAAGRKTVYVLDAHERVEVRFAAYRVVGLGDAEPHVEVEGRGGSIVVHARIDPVDDFGHRVLDFVVRWRPAAQVETVLRRVDPDVRAHVGLELPVDRVAARDENVVIGDGRRVVDPDVERRAARTSQHREHDSRARDRHDVAD